MNADYVVGPLPHCPIAPQSRALCEAWGLKAALAARRPTTEYGYMIGLIAWSLGRSIRPFLLNCRLPHHSNASVTTGPPRTASAHYFFRVGLAVPVPHHMLIGHLRPDVYTSGT